jgi:PEP-CTERM/exosortase A-associated glycosyltransferase
MRDEISSWRVMHLVDHAFPLKTGYGIRGKTIFEAQERTVLEPVVVVSPYFNCESLENGNVRGDWHQQHMTNAGVEYHFYRSDRSKLGRLAEALVRLRRFGLRGNRFVAIKIDSMARRRFIHRSFDLIKPDLVHAHSPASLAVHARWLSRKTKVPWIYEIRGFWEDSFVAEGAFTQESSLYRKLHSKETQLAMDAKCVVAISESMRQDLIGRGVQSGRIVVVPNGVDCSQFIPPEHKDHELIETLGIDGKIIAGYITNIRRLEGLDVLIEAVPAIAEKVPNFCVIIVGEGTYRPQLENLVTKLGLGEYVKFTGQVPHREIRKFYSIIDIFVIPRTNKRVNNLVTPLKPLEAMAMGKAVLASDVKALTEIVEDGRTGLVFEADNRDSLTGQCIRLAADIDLREKLGREARRWVAQERNPANMAKQYKQIYSEILNHQDCSSLGN